MGMGMRMMMYKKQKLNQKWAIFSIKKESKKKSVSKPMIFRLKNQKKLLVKMNMKMNISTEVKLI